MSAITVPTQYADKPVSCKVKVSKKDGKAVTFAVCKWLLDKSKLSDYLEKKKKPTADCVGYI